jgi:acetyltransferase-like isoleucine patch superfamily enzyme
MIEYKSMAADTLVQKTITLRRLTGKVLQFLARKTPFIPGKLRALLQAARGVHFADWRTAFIGEDVYFDDLHPENIYVGRNVRITTGARILTHYFDTKYIPSEDRPFRFYGGDVRIGDSVFIGVNALIVKPVSIGNNAVVGANAIVTKDIPANAIVVGAPARQVGIRPSMNT